MEFNKDVRVSGRKRKWEGTFVNFKKLETPPDNDFEIDGECFFEIADDNELIDCLFPYSIDDRSGVPIKPLECYLNVPDKMENPLSMQNIKWYQDQCQELQLLKQQNPHRYKDELINGVNITTYQNLRFQDSEQQWKMYLPVSMADEVIKWYHFALGHCGT